MRYIIFGMKSVLIRGRCETNVNYAPPAYGRDYFRSHSIVGKANVEHTHLYALPANLQCRVLHPYADALQFGPAIYYLKYI